MMTDSYFHWSMEKKKLHNLTNAETLFLLLLLDEMNNSFTVFINKKIRQKIKLIFPNFFVPHLQRLQAKKLIRCHFGIKQSLERINHNYPVTVIEVNFLDEDWEVALWR